MPISPKAYEDAERELCYIVVTNSHEEMMRDAFDIIFKDALRQAREEVAALIAYDITRDGHLILRGEAEAAINTLEKS